MRLVPALPLPPGRLFRPKVRAVRIVFVLLLPVLLGLFPAAAPAAPESVPAVLETFVSILPLKYFVERLAGPRARVRVLVGPGRSPATYEPTPRQMAELSGARLLFRIGVPFEEAWIPRIARMNPGLRIVDLRKGLPLRPESPAGHGRQGRSRMDPHVWTNPKHVRTMARTIRDALAGVAPADAGVFDGRLAAFLADLDALDREIRETLRGIRRRRFFVFHPAWAYLAEAYGLEQVAIQEGGREPGARTLGDMIEAARRAGVRRLFVQPQFDRRPAEAVAAAVGASVVPLDPLAEDYPENMRRVARALKEALR